MRKPYGLVPFFGYNSEIRNTGGSEASVQYRIWISRYIMRFFFTFSVSIDINIENISGKYITRKETGKVKKKNGTKTIMHSYGRPSREELVFASGTVSPVMCSSDWQQKDDQKGQAEDQSRRGQRQEARAKRRPQQGVLW